MGVLSKTPSLPQRNLSKAGLTPSTGSNASKLEALFILVLEAFVFRRAAASVIVAGALVLGTSACNFIAPQRTHDIYNPAAGVSATVGDVKVLNVMAIASEDGEAVSLVFTIANDGDRGVSVNLQYTVNGEKHTASRF